MKNSTAKNTQFSILQFLIRKNIYNKKIKGYFEVILFYTRLVLETNYRTILEWINLGKTNSKRISILKQINLTERLVQEDKRLV